MKGIIAAVLLFLPCLASASPWVGKIDLALNISPAAYQSLTDTDQAFGFGKRLWHLDRSGVETLNVGLFAGAARSDERVLAGPTIAIPGSLLDSLLGTKMGDTWIPRLKTGILIAYDITRPSTIKLRPSFSGFGVMYPIGN